MSCGQLTLVHPFNSDMNTFSTISTLGTTRELPEQRPRQERVEFAIVILLMATMVISFFIIISIINNRCFERKPNVPVSNQSSSANDKKEGTKNSPQERRKISRSEEVIAGTFGV